jgi:dipeptidase E
MKILLTSAGISNKTIEKAFRSLINGKIRIAFIPTAANIEEGKAAKWVKRFIEGYTKFGKIEAVDISTMKKEEWMPKLELANVIFVGGGDTAYLMKWIWKSGLAEEMQRLLKTRVYVGVSAGSLVLSKEIQGKGEHLYDDEVRNPSKGLGLIDFQIRPHLNSIGFPKIIEKNLKELSKKLDGDLYALDDDSAVVYNNGKIEVVSEGKWIRYSIEN